MIKIRINGGLGNQLFQYAAAYALSKKMNVPMLVDISEAIKYQIHPLRLDKLSCSAHFSIKLNVFDRVLMHPRIVPYSSKLSSRYYLEPDLRYRDLSSSVVGGTFLNGYFQCELYFKEYRKELLKEFFPNKDFSFYQREIKEKIQSTNSLSIHIRRGDYVSNPDAFSVHGICDEEYFSRSIEYFEEQNIINEKTVLFVFSDDIEWCADNLHFPFDTVFVKGDSESPELDMWLMSYCDNHIISNSTFSWWGAWINDKKDKVVVAPEKWFANGMACDIQPDTWVLK